MNWQQCITGLLAAGLTVDQIAGELGVTGNAVREVIAGRTKQPRANAALALVALCQKHSVPTAPQSPQAVQEVGCE